MSLGLRIKLSVMMILQYAVWGAWFPPLATYLLNTPEDGGLGFAGAQVGQIYSTTAIAAIISPFFLGMIADKYFSTEKCLAVLHLIGAVFLYLAAKTGPGEFGYMFSILILYCLCYMPTLALTNSISFRNMSRPDKEFPGVRVFGTIGWILIGLLIGFQVAGLQEASAQPLLVAAAISAFLGVFCFFLPHTPPLERDGNVFAMVTRPLSMMKDRAFAIFIVVSFLISIVLAFYYQLGNPFLTDLKKLNPETLPNVGPQALMTIGQIAEMILLPLLPWFVLRLGIKKTIAIGMAAWCIRYFVFSTESFWPVVLIGLVLHGICYDFFFVTSQIYVDEEAPEDIRASAQGFLGLVTLGLGMYIGALCAGWTKDWATETIVSLPPDATEAVTTVVTDWGRLWLVPFAGAVLSIILFFIFFKEPDRKKLEEVLHSHE